MCSKTVTQSLLITMWLALNTLLASNTCPVIGGVLRGVKVVCWRSAQVGEMQR